MTERIIVIGADAAGMSAASQAKRIVGDAVEIVAFERRAYSSLSACGIPYWVAGDVDGPERLVARSPDAHRSNGIDLRMRTEVEQIDLAAGRVLAHDLTAGRSFREGYDSLVIATGAVPVRPPLPGVEAAGSDCVEVLNLVSGQYQHVTLGTHANKQGRVIGHHLAGSYATFPRVVGTAVSKVCHLARRLATSPAPSR
jgi:NADPH-dependent 2,4-dienoyl-CoA reductase/sulfur reductase-like enzyme